MRCSQWADDGAYFSVDVMCARKSMKLCSSCHDSTEIEMETLMGWENATARAVTTCRLLHAKLEDRE